MGSDQPPHVALVNPGQGDAFVSPLNLLIQATATDPDGSISRVEFYDGSAKLASVTTPPYNLGWANVPVGIHRIISRH